MELGAAEIGLDVVAADMHRSDRLAGLDLRRDFPKQPSQLALQVADAGLARVVDDDPAQRLVFDHNIIRGQPVAVELALEEVIPGDGELLFLGIAVEPDDLHPIEQRRRDGVRHVRGRDEQDFGQIQVHLEVVVAERMVLRRIEHLEQRRRWIAAPVAADLVDLVQHDHRVACPSLFQSTRDAAGQRTNVGTAVATDLGLVVNSTQRDAGELPTERAGDRLAQ